MSTHLIDGKAIAAKVLDECRADAATLIAAGTTPGLAVVIVGDDPASHVYVANQVRTCGELGIHSEKIVLAADTTQQALLDVIARLNADSAIHGIHGIPSPAAHRRGRPAVWSRMGGLPVGSIWARPQASASMSAVLILRRKRFARDGFVKNQSMTPTGLFHQVYLTPSGL